MGRKLPKTFVCRNAMSEIKACPCLSHVAVTYQRPTLQFDLLNLNCLFSKPHTFSYVWLFQETTCTLGKRLCWNLQKPKNLHESAGVCASVGPLESSHKSDPRNPVKFICPSRVFVLYYQIWLLNKPCSVFRAV